jgi:hypothetical protein
VEVEGSLTLGHAAKVQMAEAEISLYETRKSIGKPVLFLAKRPKCAKLI